MRRPALLLALSYIAGVIVGGILAFPGTTAIDDALFLAHSAWALHMYGIGAGSQYFPDFIAWYGPLWDMILGLVTMFPLSFVQDPVWVRHSLNFGLLPLTLMSVALLLRSEGVRMPTVAVVVAMLLGYVRWDGQALLNTRDFPFSCAFLLVTIGMWIIVRRHRTRKTHLSIPTIAGLTLLAIIPPLIRIPAFLHTPVLIVCCLGYAIVAKNMTPARRLATALTPIVVTALALALLYPALRFFPPERWLQPFTLFGQWPIDYPYFLFGEAYSGRTTPWWYGLIWIPMGLHPLALLALIVGIVLWIVRGSISGNRFDLALGTLRLRFGLEHALLGVSLAGWLSIILMSSTLYDEDRHIQFLYLPLLVCAGLAFRRFGDRLQYAVAGLIVVCSVITFGLWGRHAYIYASPVMIDSRDAGLFSGDYWGLCVNDVIAVLPDVAPEGGAIVSSGLIDIVSLELARRQNGTFLADDRYENYMAIRTPPGSGSYLAIGLNRVNGLQQFVRDIDSGSATHLYTSSLPLGEEGCVLVRYRGE